MDVVKLVFLGILAVAFAVLVGYLVPVLLELRRTIKKIRGMADEDISPLISQVQELVAETRPKIDSITQKIEAMTEDEIKPLTSNVKEITSTVNEEVAKVNSIVDTVSDMVSKTHEVVSLYQNKAVIPAIEMVSLWDGIKKGASVLFGRDKG